MYEGVDTCGGQMCSSSGKRTLSLIWAKNATGNEENFVQRLSKHETITLIKLPNVLSESKHRIVHKTWAQRMTEWFAKRVRQWMEQERFHHKSMWAFLVNTKFFLQTLFLSRQTSTWILCCPSIMKFFFSFQITWTIKKIWSSYLKVDLSKNLSHKMEVVFCVSEICISPYGDFCISSRHPH